MATQWAETTNWNVNPPAEEIEFVCPSCKESVDVNIEDELYASFGCWHCGADLTITGKLIIEWKAQ
jgi:predicted RNA-binding Zn-ribbon protein involved in translation (DUF1610 family)